ncbi:aldo/keto reductase [Allonocardiopsis opalescens]|uniref:Aryl-alcohol dehydrogenase-like predicted oxidoreductase n=1 Tax=Allonocardiopsis opalescens TaxID=1144618 RepID=A0A2T0Q2Y2_9ACTN|nr:aldo/keto reductase [Allonocardiopsis opalescens]PRX98152.1 aryl-alcohol dehydrogenase-like predicted oxidoreductase [Allonocardiopsis opalescens]
MSTDRIGTVELGTGGPRVGAQGLGCMGMSFAYGPADDTQSRATLDRALELGVTLFDTADIYGFGGNEELLAPFVNAHRDEVFIATKFGNSRKEGAPLGTWQVRNDPAYIRQAIDASLRRLRLDRVDLYYMHRRDPEVPLAESIGALAELVAEGKVGHLGLSEVTGAELREAHAVHPIAAVQSEWSLFTRDLERSLVAAAAELGTAVVPYSPLGRGFLTGSLPDARELPDSDYRRILPRFSGGNAEANAALLEPVRAIAAARGITPGQVALAWVHQRAAVHGVTVVPIPGTRRPERLEENLAAVGIELTQDELDALEPIASKVAGDRYADMSTTSTARE